eukprot:TRINITY_DN54995_c0_g1_i1.p1 TRINITY_DN54995_c0_g1~~TRINITY_DN54995_c0_g1_i1.p1  ORF type:complete len:163 (-),score=17.72 TRINITY_DN54995_c0_g1_i1:63-551(-)
MCSPLPSPPPETVIDQGSQQSHGMVLPRVSWCRPEELKTLTPSRAAVYHLLCCVPRGFVTTYGDVAKVLGSSGLSVGSACRRNPFYPKVPCFRIVNAGGVVGAAAEAGGKKQASRREQLLRKEGIEIKNRRVRKLGKHLYTFTRKQRSAALRLRIALCRSQR